MSAVLSDDRSAALLQHQARVQWKEQRRARGVCLSCPRRTGINVATGHYFLHCFPCRVTYALVEKSRRPAARHQRHQAIFGDFVRCQHTACVRARRSIRVLERISA